MTSPHRRNQQSRQAIMRAAMEICQERGYAALTVEGVAARAGVGKQTIYRWWPSKGAVVLDAFLDTIGPAIEVTEHEGHLDWLSELLRRSAGLMSDPRLGPMVADLVGAMQHDPALAADFQARVFQPVRAATVARVRRAQASGDLREIDPDIVADLLFGPLWFRQLVMRVPPGPAYADMVINTVVAGLRPGGKPARHQSLR